MFEPIADARKGTAAVNRIYRGDTLAWSRYNWEKWSCRTNYEVGVSASFLSQGRTDASESMSGVVYYTGYEIHSGYLVFTGRRTGGASATLQTLVGTHGSIYLGDGDPIYPGSLIPYYSGPLVGIPPTVARGYLHVEETQDLSGYSKGGEKYGIVSGEQGDYPADGRHSDGYWYVFVGAKGFEAEGGSQ